MSAHPRTRPHVDATSIASIVQRRGSLARRRTCWWRAPPRTPRSHQETLIPVAKADADVVSATAETDALVRELWARFGAGGFASAAALFHADATYHDTLYPKPFVGELALRTHFAHMERAFGGRGLRFVVDDLAAADGVAGVRWHVALRNGTPLPLGRGASTYRAAPDSETGGLLLVEAWDFPEPSFKVAPLVLPVLGLVVRLLEAFPQLVPPPGNQEIA
jgi:SnoaL-like domain